MSDLNEFLNDPWNPGDLTPEQAATLLRAASSLHEFLEDQVDKAYTLISKWTDDIRVRYLSAGKVTFVCRYSRRYEDYESWEETFPLADLLSPNFPDMYLAKQQKLKEEARLLEEQRLRDQAEANRQRDLAELARLTEKYGLDGKGK